MSNFSKIYWLTRLDNIQTFFVWLLVFCVLTILIYLITFVISYDMWDKEEAEAYKKNYNKYKNAAIGIGIFVGICLTFLPTKNDMILIYAGGSTMNYLETDSSLAKIPYQTTSIISSYLDNKIKELKDEKK